MLASDKVKAIDNEAEEEADSCAFFARANPRIREMGLAVVDSTEHGTEHSLVESAVPR